MAKTCDCIKCDRTATCNRYETGCCPRFDPALWNGKTFNWQDKLFIKDSVSTFFHIPWPPSIGKLMARMYQLAQAAGAAPQTPEFIMLAYDPTPFKCEYYLSVTKEVPGAANVKLTGTFIAKVFDGPYGDVPKWIKEMDAYLAGQGEKAQKYYFYYTTCPKCAKAYGHNYVVAFAQV